MHAAIRPTPIDFRKLHADVHVSRPPLPHGDAVIVRTMPPGSLEQVVFRMDLLHRLQRRGVRVLNPPRAVETCVDKYLATARLEAAGLPRAADRRLPARRRRPGGVRGPGRRRGRQAAVRLRGPRHGARLATPKWPGGPSARWNARRAVLYLQQFIRHPGWDLRVFVLGGRC